MESSRTYRKIAEVMIRSHGINGNAEFEVSEALLAVIEYARMELVYSNDQLEKLFSSLLLK